MKVHSVFLPILCTLRVRRACAFVININNHLSISNKRGKSGSTKETTLVARRTSVWQSNGDTQTNCKSRSLLISRRKMATMDSPSAERNKEAIWSVLSTVVSASTSISAAIDFEKVNSDKKGGNRNKKYNPIPYKVLEIAAGTGVHTHYFTSQLINNYQRLNVSWYPTDPNEQCRRSIQDRTRNASSEVVKASINPAVALTLNDGGMLEEVTRGSSEEGGGEVPLQDLTGGFDLITCINMIHISPWEATVGLMKVASAYLTENGVLYCYGPYKVEGTAVQSNLNFDASLKARDPTWGVRNVEDVIELARMNGLSLDKNVDMPANNLSLIFRKTLG